MTVSDTEFTPSENGDHTSLYRAMVCVSRLAGIQLKTDLDEVRLIQQGISPEAIDRLRKFTGSSVELHWIIKPRTLAHRKSTRENLTQEETGRWLRAAKVQALAREVFGDSDKASSWLQKPRRIFGGQSALLLSQTEPGALMVLDALIQIDVGYFA